MASVMPTPSNFRKTISPNAYAANVKARMPAAVVTSEPFFLQPAGDRFFQIPRPVDSSLIPRE